MPLLQPFPPIDCSLSEFPRISDLKKSHRADLRSLAEQAVLFMAYYVTTSSMIMHHLASLSILLYLLKLSPSFSVP